MSTWIRRAVGCTVENFLEDNISVRLELYSSFLGKFRIYSEPETYDKITRIVLACEDGRQYGCRKPNRIPESIEEVVEGACEALEEVILADMCRKLPRMDRIVRYGNV